MYAPVPFSTSATTLASIASRLGYVTPAWFKTKLLAVVASLKVIWLKAADSKAVSATVVTVFPSLAPSNLKPLLLSLVTSSLPSKTLPE